MRRDVRPRLIAAVIADPDLSYRDKLYMITVATVTAEYRDGKRRYGSRAMDESGRFALNVDYIARCMGKTEHAANEARKALQESRWLDRIHESRHARPATYQALLAGSARAPLREGFLRGLRESENTRPKERAEAQQGPEKHPPLPIERLPAPTTYPRPASHPPAARRTSGSDGEQPPRAAAGRLTDPEPSGFPDDQPTTTETREATG